MRCSSSRRSTSAMASSPKASTSSTASSASTQSTRARGGSRRRSTGCGTRATPNSRPSRVPRTRNDERRRRGRQAEALHGGRGRGRQDVPDPQVRPRRVRRPIRRDARHEDHEEEPDRAAPGWRGRVSVDVILWDIMGTPMLRELLKEAYYHGANGILAVADLTRHHTLAALDEWSRSIRSVAGDIPTYGVVNKEDLHPEREITSAEVESFFRDRAWSWSYASAKTGSGVEKSFQDLVGDVLARRA